MRVILAGMNMISENDRNLVETLKSLSIDAKGQRPKQPAIGRRPVLWVGLAMTALGGTLCLVLWPFDPGKAGPSGRSDADFGAQPALVAGNRAIQSVPEPVSSPILVQEIAGSGYVTASHSISVYSRQAGTIVDIEIEAGDQVAAGQVLLTLDEADVRFELEEARLAKASSVLALAARRVDQSEAKTNFDRVAALVVRAAVATQRRDEAEAALARANNAVLQAQHDLARADLAMRRAAEAMDQMVVRAPISGVVTILNAQLGDGVLSQADSTGPNQSLMTLTDTTSLVIDADVAERHIAVLKPGLKGEAVLDGFPETPFSIELARVAPVASAEKGTIGLRFRLVDPPLGVRLNMAARVRVTIPTSTTERGIIK